LFFFFFPAPTLQCRCDSAGPFPFFFSSPPAGQLSFFPQKGRSEVFRRALFSPFLPPLSRADRHLYLFNPPSRFLPLFSPSFRGRAQRSAQPGEPFFSPFFSSKRAAEATKRKCLSVSPLFSFRRLAKEPGPRHSFSFPPFGFRRKLRKIELNSGRSLPFLFFDPSQIKMNNKVELSFFLLFLFYNS